jgi:hypothetical protein
MKRLLFVLFILSGMTLSASAQSISDWKLMLDDFCERHFEDCFDWDYIKIVSIEDIKKISGSEFVIEGVVQNKGFFDSVHNRDFKAKVTLLYNGEKRIKFSKHGSNGIRGDFWTDCTKTIN